MSENWNLSGLILEGICGTGKTTLFRSITQSPQFSRRTALTAMAMSEHHTQRVLEEKERKEGLCLADNLSLLDSHVSYLELLNRRLAQMKWCENKRTNMRICYLLERFHFTHVCHYSHVAWENVQPIDARLARLNGKLCLLTVDESKLEERILAGRDAGWHEYLKTHGQTMPEIVGHYVEQQRRLIDLCARSSLPTVILNTSELSTADTLTRALEFWGDI
mgnify:CR=1 FL=1